MYMAQMMVLQVLVLLGLLPLPHQALEALPRVPALFIFGASFVDAGNNNDLNSTTAKANYLPYGRDFPGDIATGRFSDGFLIPDYIASYLGLPLIPAFRSSHHNFNHGTNFAQAGCGLFNTTGDRYTLYPNPNYPAPLPAQVINFQKVKQILIAQNGPLSATTLISEAIFLMAIGDNDFATNYFDLPNQEIYTVPEFADVLISIYASQIQKLYQEGARKFIIISLRPLGCAPHYLVIANITRIGQCHCELNEAIQIFNQKLQIMLEEVKFALQDSKFLYADAYNPMYDMVQNPEIYGFKVVNVACCNFVGTNLNRNLTCPAGAPICNEPTSYVFWDHMHTTSHVYKILADFFWRGSTEYIYPINIMQLVQSSYEMT